MSNDRGRAFWEKLVAEVAAGASQMSVAKKHGVSPSWLGRWCRQAQDSKSKAALLPVRVVEGRARRVELCVGAVRVSFDEGVDPQYIAALARTLAS